jgi:probable blue pigment (indigoidine) exporter
MYLRESFESMPLNSFKRYKWIAAGLAFAALWASASTATKIGLVSAQPLVIAETRFALAAIIMLFIAHLARRKRLPKGHEWKQLAIYGALNVAIYLGCYIIAMQTITAGIGALAVATNPVFISFLSVIFLKKKLTPSLICSIVVCMTGVVCAAWPLFNSAEVTVAGLLILLFSMLSYSVAAIYFSAKKWDGLDLFTINGWQTFIGGLLLFPVALFFYKKDLNHLDKAFWGSVSWLAIPVSVFAVQLWLWLLRANPVRAGLWLFLCPLFGFSFAAWLMKEPLTIYTVVGVLLVIGGLLLSGISGKKNEMVFD